MIRFLDTSDYHETGISLNCQRRQPNAEAVWSLAFNSNGKRLAAGYSNNNDNQPGSGLVCVFDLEDGSISKWSSVDRGGQHADVFSVAYGGKPGKEFVVFGGSDKILRKWDLSTGSVVGVNSETEIGTVAFNADESKVAVAGNDGIIRIRNLAELDKQGRELNGLKGHEGTVQQMLFSPADPKVLISAGDDGRIIAWNLAGECQTQSKQLDVSVYGMAINPEGIVATAGGDGYVRLFRLSANISPCPKPAKSSSKIPKPKEFEVVKEGELVGHGGMILAVAFDPEGLHLASAGQDGSIRIWMGNTGSFSLAELISDPKRTGKVTNVVISPNGDLIASGDDKGNIFLRNGPKESVMPNGRMGEPRRQDSTRDWKAHDGSIRSLIFVPVGGRLALISGGEDGVLKQWDVSSGKIISQMTDGAKRVVSMALSPDGKTLAAGSDDGAVRLWDTLTRTRVDKVDPPDPTSVPNYALSAVGFTRDGKYLATGSSRYANLRVIDLKDRSKLSWWLQGHNPGVSSICRGELEWLLSSGSDGSILEWEESALGQPSSQSLKKRDDFKFRTGSRELRPLQSLTAMATSADGRLVLAGGDKGQVQLWNGAEHVLISDHFTAHNTKIEAVAVAPDGSFFVTADSRKILVWPGPDRWADILCSKLTQNMSDKHWSEWVSPSIPYTLQCPGLPKEADERARR